MSSVAPQILDSILSAIGNTPMVRLRSIGKEYPAEICAKCEFMNPGGSVKDRIAVQMVLEAQDAGRIKPGDYLVEPTSGNTGIGLALAGAVLGYKVIIVMPEKMSQEKQVTMEALGAQIVRTPTGAAHDSPNSNFSVAKRIVARLPNAHILDQFGNCVNPRTHYHSTAHEILEQCGGHLDYLVCSAGTGGTITGTARRLKEVLPSVKVIGVDPVGSIFAGVDERAGSPYQIEGIGYDFIPDNLDCNTIDAWEKTEDNESFGMALRLIREEGMLVGGSSGATMAGALRVASRCKSGERVVAILSDGIRNYMTKFLCDEWMQSHGFDCMPKAKHVDWEALVADGG